MGGRYEPEPGPTLAMCIFEACVVPEMAEGEGEAGLVGNNERVNRRKRLRSVVWCRRAFLELHRGVKHHRLGSRERTWNWEALVGIALEIVWGVLMKAAAVGVAVAREVIVREVVDWEAGWHVVVCKALAIGTVWGVWTVEVLMVSVAVGVSIASAIVISGITSTRRELTTTSGTVIAVVVSMAIATRCHLVVGSPGLIARRSLRIHGGMQVEAFVGIMLLLLANRSENERKSVYLDGFLVVAEEGKSDSAYQKRLARDQ